MYKFTKYLLLFFALTTVACDKEEVPTLYEISDEFLPFVDAFFEEAAIRGVALNKENLIISFTSEITEEFCGQCKKPKKDKAGQRYVEINDAENCWGSESQQNKEALIFHELGHCLLGRSNHKNELFSDGSPKSLMTTILDGPYQPCGYVIGGGNDGGECNRTIRRSYYLDELFNQNIDVIPDWVNQ